jgi:hypothetical protein
MDFRAELDLLAREEMHGSEWERRQGASEREHRHDALDRTAPHVTERSGDLELRSSLERGMPGPIRLGEG